MVYPHVIKQTSRTTATSSSAIFSVLLQAIKEVVKACFEVEYDGIGSRIKDQVSRIGSRIKAWFEVGVWWDWSKEHYCRLQTSTSRRSASTDISISASVLQSDKFLIDTSVQLSIHNVYYYLCQYCWILPIYFTNICYLPICCQLLVPRFTCKGSIRPRSRILGPG